MSQVSSYTLKITGMDCAACAQTIERGVAKLEGVQTASLNFTSETLRVEGTISQETIVRRVRELGYDIAPPTQPSTLHSSGQASNLQPLTFWRFMRAHRNTQLALLGALLILPGLLFNELLPFLGFSHPLLDGFSIAAMLIAGFPIARSAGRAVTINREININVLMTIAAIGAAIIGEYTEAGLVITLFAIGEALEGYTAQRARDSIRSLVALTPRRATVLRPCMDCQGHLGQDGYTGGPCPFCGVEMQLVDVDELVIGDRIVVKPGERIPMDGRILAGASSVNQAAITGESLPVTRQPGEDVFAGSINGEGALEVAVTHLAADNTIARMIQMVEDAQDKKAPAQRFVDRFARVYTPAVVAVAALVAVIPPVFFGEPFWNPDPSTQGWLYRALELLVIACPCALVISTPVSLISAISNAARNGILIKGGAHLETLAKVRAMAFDKTGTLTEGKPAVIGVHSIACTNPETGTCEMCDDLLARASAVERHSEHPLAGAIVRASEMNGVQHRYPAADGVKALAGKGVSGQVNGREVIIGSHTFFDSQFPHPAGVCEAVEHATRAGYTPLLVSDGQMFAGYITVADVPRADSQAALSALRKEGMEHLIMLTGDNETTAQTIAGQVGVTDVRANLLPEHKVNAARALLAEFGTMAMVGDGINDAPALATASVGIAMGGAGTQAAMETADVVLMGDDLAKLPFLIRLSKMTMRVIRANIALSLGIKAAFLLLVLFGWGTMWLAVLADVGTSLLVTGNGMRLNNSDL
ncbi:MAG: heavy metal translocating P-type ATPase [Anaerolineales bacterium]